MLRELIIFSSVLTDFIMNIKKNSIGKSKHLMDNLIEIIDKNEFRLTRHINERLKNYPEISAKEKLKRWNFNNLIELVNEKDHKNVLDLVHKIEYDSKTKIKLTQDKKKLNMSNRRLLI
jgi:vacuolar-type H+-ATPase subunit I/STV1